MKNVYPFNEEEMFHIGKSVRSMTRRMKKLTENTTIPLDGPLTH